MEQELKKFISNMKEAARSQKWSRGGCRHAGASETPGTMETEGMEAECAIFGREDAAVSGSDSGLTVQNEVGK